MRDHFFHNVLVVGFFREPDVPATKYPAVAGKVSKIAGRGLCPTINQYHRISI
jgi:hypothetical protein